MDAFFVPLGCLGPLETDDGMGGSFAKVSVVVVVVGKELADSSVGWQLLIIVEDNSPSASVGTDNDDCVLGETVGKLPFTERRRDAFWVSLGRLGSLEPGSVVGKPMGGTLEWFTT